jgi:Holliday junction DNA helicase RuvA
VITKITGQLVDLADDSATLAIDPFEYEVLVPDFTRRALQMKLQETVSLHTIQYIDGNVQKGGRMTPRFIGFNSEIERQFFELFCSVDGVGVKKALRAMVRPVPDIASAIEQQDIKVMTTLPGIGAATAERIVAKLRRKMARFALLVAADMQTQGDPGSSSVVEETYQILLSLNRHQEKVQKRRSASSGGLRSEPRLNRLLLEARAKVAQG